MREVIRAKVGLGEESRSNDAAKRSARREAHQGEARRAGKEI